MIFPRIRKIAKDNKFYKTSNIVFGKYRDYLFSLGDGQGFKLVNVLMEAVEEEKLLKIKNDLEFLKNKKKISEVIVEDGSIIVKIKEVILSASEKKIYFVMDTLVEALKKNNVEWKEECFSCSTDQSELGYYNFDGEGVILCNYCYERVIRDYEEEKKDFMYQEKNYVSGAIGASIFSLGGVLAWVVLGYFFNRIALFVVLLITFLSMKGYDFFKGKPGPLTKWIITSINIIAIVVANYIIVIFSGLRGGYTIKIILGNLRYNEMLKNELMRQIKNSLALSSIAIIYMLYVLHKSTVLPKNLIREAKRV